MAISIPFSNIWSSIMLFTKAYCICLLYFIYCTLEYYIYFNWSIYQIFTFLYFFLL